MDKTVYLIRHTAVMGMVGRCYGRMDAPLTGTFSEEADKIKSLLSRTPPQLFLSSPATRCRKLAHFLSDGLFETSERLQEFDFGLWEGQNWNDIPRVDFDIWSNDLWNRSCPEGETLREFTARVLSFWHGLPSMNPSVIALITHAGPIRAILADVMGIHPLESWNIEVPIGTVRILTLQGFPNPSWTLL